jgi:hypothetical protein
MTVTPSARWATLGHSTARLAVVDALATIDGLTATPSMPDTPDAGSAWPVWSESRYRDGKLSHPLAHTYEVRVILPAAYHPDTVDAADGLIEQVCNALSKVGTVDVANPVSLVFEQNQTSMPGLSVRVTVSTC